MSSNRTSAMLVNDCSALQFLVYFIISRIIKFQVSRHIKYFQVGKVILHVLLRSFKDMVKILLSIFLSFFLSPIPFVRVHPVYST